MTSRRRRKRKKLECHNEGENRSSCIIDLPDDCLVRILSFHDTRTTVQSSLLVSKRWKDLWTSVPSLSFTNPLVISDVRKNGFMNFVDKSFINPFHSSGIRNKNLFRKNGSRKKGLMQFVGKSYTNPLVSSGVINTNGFMNFVDKVLELRRNDVNLQSFHIDSDYDCHSRLISWISYAAMHGVEDLRVCVKTVFYAHVKLPAYVKLPECLFTCQTIKVLQLISCRRALLFPSPVASTSFNLPQLQVLHLHGVKCKDGNPISAALAGCPNLDTLVIRCCSFQDPYNLHISSPKLKKLAVTELYDYVVIKIYAPNLTWLELVSVSSQNTSEDWLSEVLESSPVLQTLVVRDVSLIGSGEWIPVAFANCPFLQTVIIRSCSTYNLINDLHISSQYLEKLDLSHLRGIPNTTLPIYINAPNLTSLTLLDEGDSRIRKRYSLCNVKSVVKAEIGIFPKIDPSELEMKDAKRVMKVLNSLSSVKELSMLEPSTVLAITKQLNLSNLRSLELHVWFYGPCVFPLTKLLKSSPDIETLIMVKEEIEELELGFEFQEEPEQESEEEEDEAEEISLNHLNEEMGYYEFEGMFNHVKTLEMKNFSATEDELEFLRAVLKTALVLEKVIFTIAYRTVVGVKQRMKRTELAKFQRASPDILFSFIHPQTSLECGKFNLRK